MSTQYLKPSQNENFLWGGEDAATACFATEDMLYYLPMLRSFQFRCRPNDAQTAALKDMVFKKNALYNAGLEQRIAAYRRWRIHHHKVPAWENHKHRINGKRKKVPVIRPKNADGEAKHSLSWYDQKAALKVVREENPEYAAFLQRIPNLALKDLDLAFQAFFRRLRNGQKPGFPRFKSARRVRQSLKLGEGVKWHKGKSNFGHIAFKGLPGKLRFKIHNPLLLDGIVKETVLTRDHKGFLVTFQCELPAPSPIKVTDYIGTDLGLTKLLSMHDGEIVERERFFKNGAAAVRRAGRALSRRKNKRTGKQARLANQRAHAKIANQRKTFLRQAAAKIIAKCVAEKKGLALDGINVKGLCRGILAGEFHDAALGQFSRMLAYKAESAGIPVVMVDPRYTSQTCSVCGAIEKKSLSQRFHECSACGHENDRDAEAAEIIRKKAVMGLEAVVGLGDAKRNKGNSACPTNLSLAFQ